MPRMNTETEKDLHVELLGEFPVKIRGLNSDLVNKRHQVWENPGAEHSRQREHVQRL